MSDVVTCLYGLRSGTTRAPPFGLYSIFLLVFNVCVCVSVRAYMYVQVYTHLYEDSSGLSQDIKTRDHEYVTGTSASAGLCTGARRRAEERNDANRQSRHDHKNSGSGRRTALEAEDNSYTFSVEGFLLESTQPSTGFEGSTGRTFSRQEP